MSADGPLPAQRMDIETIRLTASNFVAKLKSRASIDTIRPLPIFLGLQQNSGSNDLALSPKAFSAPSSTMDRSLPNKIKNRVKVNCSFFLSNYVLLCAMTAIVVALMHPAMLATLSIVYGLWWLHGYLIRHELVLLGVHVQNLMTVQQRFYVLFAITAIVIVWQCLLPMAVFVAISTLIVLSHAALRDISNLEEAAGETGAKPDDDLGFKLEEGNAGLDGSPSNSETVPMLDKSG